jgi:hypothetical protein
MNTRAILATPRAARVTAVHARACTLSVALLIMLFGLGACGQSDDKPIAERPGNAAADSVAAPMHPDDQRGVDLGRWIEMERKDFENQFTTFAQSEPPVVRDYGICDSITCHFPSTAEDALAEILVCDLNGVYLVTDAFRLLGIEIGQVGSSSGPWTSVTSLDKRFESLRYKNAGGADRTTQILLQFHRGSTRN